MERPIDHVLPFDKRVIAAANCGVPIATALLRFSSFSRALEKLADDVAGLIGEASLRSELAEQSLLGSAVAKSRTTATEPATSNAWEPGR
jgi:MinD-like ATPase involved in chromosome partitioning or flagellar assembly